MRTLDEEYRALVLDVLRRRLPERENLKAAVESGELSEGVLAELEEILTDEFVSARLDAAYEPMGYGLRIEEVLERLV